MGFKDLINEKRNKEEVMFEEKVYSEMISLYITDLLDEVMELNMSCFQAFDPITFNNIAKEFLNIETCVTEHEKNKHLGNFEMFEWLEPFFDKAYENVTKLN